MRKQNRLVMFWTLLVSAGVLAGCATTRRYDVNDESSPHASTSGLGARSEGDEFVGPPRLAKSTGVGASGRDPSVARSSGRTASADGDAAAGVPPLDLPPSIPPPEREYPIDLDTALRLAEAENPAIAGARQMIGEALALQQKARVLMLPSLNAGSSYHDHTGNLERSSGVILNVNQKSLYFGGGVMPVTAGTLEIPAVSIFSPLTDAIFEPLAAHQRVAVTEFEAATTNNNTLRDVAVFHYELIAAEADLGVRRLSAAQEAEVARLTRAYADAGEGREADAERAATELRLIEVEVRQAEEQVAVAAARLSQRLHLDQSVRLRPVPPPVEMVTLIDPAAPLPELIQVAIQRRPESGARASAISEAEYRHKQELYRPLLPTVGLGFSGGVFGGGSNIVGPELAHFGGRTDLDVMAFWTLRNFGFGNLAIQRQRRAEVGEAQAEQARIISQIRSEVSEAHAQVMAAKNRVDVATRQLASAESGFNEDFQRIKNTVGRPIEVVNSLELLNHARVDRIRAILDYNTAEIRLFVSLGSPPPVEPSHPTDIENAPVASPPLPPLDGLVGRTKGGHLH